MYISDRIVGLRNIYLIKIANIMLLIKYIRISTKIR